MRGRASTSASMIWVVVLSALRVLAGGKDSDFKSQEE